MDHAVVYHLLAFLNMQTINSWLRLIVLGFTFLHSPGARAQGENLRSLTRTEIQILQEALTWAGSYYALKDGNWGKIAADAAADWRRNNGLPPSDFFTNSELRLLLTQGSRERAATDWTTFLDASTGVWIGYPRAFAQLRSSGASNMRVAVTDLHAIDGTLDIKLFGPGLDLNQLREMLASLEQEPQVEQVAYRLDRANRQVQSTNLRSGMVRYIRFDRADNVWRGFAINISMERQDVGRLISAISGEFSASGHSVIELPTNLPRLGSILANIPALGKAISEPADLTVEIPPPRR